MSILTLSLTLFLIMDPLGNCAAFLRAMKQVKPKRRNLVIIREHLLGLLTILFFCFVGEYIFSTLLGVNDVTVMIATGVILFLIAIKRLFPGAERPDDWPKGEPLLVPLAIPFTAGPSLLATVMLYAHLEPTGWMLLTAVGVAWCATFLFHLIGPRILDLVGDGGLAAFERLSGLILILLGVEDFMQGIDLFMKAVS